MSRKNSRKSSSRDIDKMMQSSMMESGLSWYRPPMSDDDSASVHSQGMNSVGMNSLQSASARGNASVNGSVGGRSHYSSNRSYMGGSGGSVAGSTTGSVNMNRNMNKNMNMDQTVTSLTVGTYSKNKVKKEHLREERSRRRQKLQKEATSGLGPTIAGTRMGPPSSYTNAHAHAHANSMNSISSSGASVMSASIPEDQQSFHQASNVNYYGYKYNPNAPPPPPQSSQPYGYMPNNNIFSYLSNTSLFLQPQRRLMWISVMTIGFISALNIVTNSIETRRSVLENSIGFIQAQESSQNSQQIYQNVNQVYSPMGMGSNSGYGMGAGANAGGVNSFGMSVPSNGGSLLRGDTSLNGSPSSSDSDSNNNMALHSSGGGYITDSGEVVESLPDPIVQYGSEEQEKEHPPNLQEQFDPENPNNPNANSESSTSASGSSSSSIEDTTATDMGQNMPPEDMDGNENAPDSDVKVELLEDLSGPSSSETNAKEEEESSFLDWFLPIFDQAPVEDVPEIAENRPRLELVGEEVDENENVIENAGDDDGHERSSLHSNQMHILQGLPEVQRDGTIPLRELSNIKDNYDDWDRSDVPIFLHIPKAGGSTVKDIMGTCHRFVMATETGILDGHIDDEEIAVVYPGGGPAGQDRSPFVNVDTTTLAGIARAREMGFADSHLAEAVVTPFIFEVNDLFTDTTQGRLFTVFRHPIERAISMFYYIQIADWEPTYSPELKFWTLEQYARSDLVENNWLTRMLSNQPHDEISDVNLDIAKEVIRRKIVVGLVTKMEETIERFESFFRWRFRVMPANQEACRTRLLERGSNSNSQRGNQPEPGSAEWDMLVEHNKYDLELYEYIEELFDEQKRLVKNLPTDYRNIDATCCKCAPPTFPSDHQYECPMSIMN